MSAPSIVCPVCGSRSYNPNDIEQGYCGRCHWWTSDPMLAPYQSAASGVLRSGVRTGRKREATARWLSRPRSSFKRFLAALRGRR